PPGHRGHGGVRGSPPPRRNDPPPPPAPHARPHIHAQPDSPIKSKSSPSRTHSVHSRRARFWVTAISVPAPAWITDGVNPSHFARSPSAAMSRLADSRRSALSSKVGSSALGAIPSLTIR